MQVAISTLNGLQTNASTLEQIRRHGDDRRVTEYNRMQQYMERVGIAPSDLQQLNAVHVSGTKGKVMILLSCPSPLRRPLAGICVCYGGEYSKTPWLEHWPLCVSQCLYFEATLVQLSRHQLSTFTGSEGENKDPWSTTEQGHVCVTLLGCVQQAPQYTPSL